MIFIINWNGQPHFRNLAQVITWQNLFPYFLQLNLRVCLSGLFLLLLVLLLLLLLCHSTRITHKSACNSFVNHFNLFELVRHFKWLNLATKQMSTHKRYGLRFVVWLRSSFKWFKFNIIRCVWCFSYAQYIDWTSEQASECVPCMCVCACVQNADD